MFTWLAILCCHLVCGGGEAKSPCKSYADLKKEKIRSPNDSWKGYLKTWDWWNNQSFQVHCLWTPQGELTAPHMNPQLQGPMCWHMWVMTYIHKTQSFMKNRSQQKCLAKALKKTNTERCRGFRAKERSKEQDFTKERIRNYWAKKN